MRTVRFLARDAAEAVAQARSRLGPGAVMVSLRPVAPAGLSRLWRRPMLEVRAQAPSQTEVPPPKARSSPRSAPALPRRRKVTKRRKPATRARARPAPAPAPVSEAPPAPAPEVPPAPAPASNPEAGLEAVPPGLGGRWRSGAVLCQMGLQPIHVERVLERARAQHGQEPPAAFGEEMALVRAALAGFWRAAPEEGGKSTPIHAPESPARLPQQGWTSTPIHATESPARPPQQGWKSTPIHAFVGPPGSGKTTVLCKWLAKAVLEERRAARVWRLDSRAPNFGIFLDFYAEALGVRVDRAWKGSLGLAGCEVGFVDLPGVPIVDTGASEQLRAQLVRLHGVQTHLVLNAAYETPVLMAQARAFEDWPLSDLILTHVDEERRLGKLWNLVLGTKFTIRFLAGGQNLPGEFVGAAPGLLIPG